MFKIKSKPRFSSLLMYIYTCMIRSRLKISFICLLLLGKTVLAQVYEVTFLGIPVVYVHLNKTELNHKNLLSIQYKAETTTFFSRIFLVRNNYWLTMDKNLKSVYRYEKNIIQKNLRQDLITIYNEEYISYSNGEIRTISGRFHNMLSLIIALAGETEANVQHNSLEIEGEFFNATALPVFRDEQTIRWEIRTEKTGGQPILNDTDLFTSRLGDPAAFRSITVDKNRQLIVEAHFSVSRYKLSAKLVDEKP